MNECSFVDHGKPDALAEAWMFNAFLCGPVP